MIFFVISIPSFDDSFHICFHVFFLSCISILFIFIFHINSATYFSIFSFQIIYHHTTHKSIQENIYIKVTFNQKSHKNIARATSFTSGEVIKKEKVIPRGIPHFKKPINNGIELQLQKGVIAPKNDARKYSNQ